MFNMSEKTKAFDFDNGENEVHRFFEIVHEFVSYWIRRMKEPCIGKLFFVFDLKQQARNGTEAIQKAWESIPN